MPSPHTIATRLFGAIDWQTEVHGFCRCPGEALHTSRTGPKDCQVHIDGAPTLHCFHASCTSAVAAANKQLRRELGQHDWAIRLPSGKVLNSGDVLQPGGQVLPREVIEAKAVRDGTAFDPRTTTIVLIGYAIPDFLFAILLVVLFAGGSFWNLFPLGGFRPDNWEYLGAWGKITGQLHHMALPVFCYMVGAFATETILTKNSLMENLGQDYVRTAFAKGLSERRVIFVHALRKDLGSTIDVLDYAEHAMGQGSEATAVAYVETTAADGEVRWGVGTDPSTITAALRAVLNAHERHSAE